MRTKGGLLKWLSSSFCKSTMLKNPGFQNYHQGGLSSVNKATIDLYMNALQQRRQQQWKQSIMDLQKVIKTNPVLRYNWEYGISRADNLKGKSGKDVLGLLNGVLHTAPAFNTKELVGFPINAIFNDLMQNQNGRLLFSNFNVNSALQQIFSDYAAMLQSPLSLAFMNQQEPAGWFSPAAAKLVNYSQYEIPSNGFKNWNEWFLRKFKPGQRPVGLGTPNELNTENVVVNSCESSPIIYPHQPIRGVKKSDDFWLKDDKYSLQDMFGPYGVQKGYHNLFVGGTVYQAFLSALAYHHWHSPIDGEITDIYRIPGCYFLDRSQFNHFYDPASPNDSQSFLSATSARMVIMIKAKNQGLGYLAIIFIGMAELSSCISTQSIGNKVKKGDHLGYFAYGGSSHVILFQPTAKITFSQNLYESTDQGNKGKTQNLSSYLAHIS